MILRGYQSQAIADIRTALRSHRRVLFTAPTGSGKGLLISFMMKEAAARGLTSWMVCHRKELLDQTSAGLSEVGVPHGRIAAGRIHREERIQIASVQTLVRRLHLLQPPALLVADEAHHAPSATFRKIMEHCNKSRIVGLTATPVRTSGEGLDDLFDTLVLGPTVEELIERGYLAKYRLLGPPAGAVDVSKVHTRHGDYVTAELEAVVDRKGVLGDAVAHYKKFVAPLTCLVFCVSRKHAHHVEDAYRAAGVNALYVGGDTPDAERRQALQDFKQGRLPVITSVEIFSEGVDSPGLRAVQLLRPTQSLGLFLQQCGRGLRVEPGKKECIILDHVGSSFTHGLVDDPRDWTLEGRRRRATGENAPALRSCKACFAIYRAHLRTCPECGEVSPVLRDKLPDQHDGELSEVDIEARRAERRSEEGAARTLEDLVRLAKRRGYRAAWAGIRHALRTKTDRMTAIRKANQLWKEVA